MQTHSSAKKPLSSKSDANSQRQGFDQKIESTFHEYDPTSPGTKQIQTSFLFFLLIINLFYFIRYYS